MNLNQDTMHTDIFSIIKKTQRESSVTDSGTL